MDPRLEIGLRVLFVVEHWKGNEMSGYTLKIRPRTPEELRALVRERADLNSMGWSGKKVRARLAEIEEALSDV